MKILITGFSGFVSEYFLEYLNTVETNCSVLGVSRSMPQFDLKQFNNLQIEFKSIDLLNRSEVEKVITEFQPEFILHLASVSSVAQNYHKVFASFVQHCLQMQDVKYILVESL